MVPLAAISLVAALFGVWSTEGADTATVVIAVVMGVAALGSLPAAFFVGRSISKGLGEVTAATDRIAKRDLIDILDALRSPETDVSAIGKPRLDTRRGDEVGELARSVDGLHRSLLDVASRQMDALRSGISNILVTLARRNSSLVDRQLAVLDELEDREEDPRILSGYYRLDHLATRMRRNAESLLVLAGSESPRIWAKPTDMADVVRAAVGEVDEFQRIEVPALEPARMSGSAVSDISHLLAELLENAIQFSPPSEPVRVMGLFGVDGYQITVSDRGVGMTEARVAELNRILEKPPALGLSVEPTLGIYVVSKLAHRHGVRVELVRGVPGVTARVTVPRDHLEAVKKSQPGHWDTERESDSGGPDPDEYTDAATREYILKRTNRDLEPAPAASEETNRVIDLTDDELADDATPRQPGPQSGLPVRNPGQTLGTDDASSASTGPGEGAIGIKSALAAFDAGRRAAEEAVDEQGEER
ncbi:MAG TPA: ATP-binding protein [Acidimicrobiia bacterium]